MSIDYLRLELCRVLILATELLVLRFRERMYHQWCSAGAVLGIISNQKKVDKTRHVDQLDRKIPTALYTAGRFI